MPFSYGTCLFIFLGMSTIATSQEKSDPCHVELTGKETAAEVEALINIALDMAEHGKCPNQIAANEPSTGEEVSRSPAEFFDRIDSFSSGYTGEGPCGPRPQKRHPGCALVCTEKIELVSVHSFMGGGWIENCGASDDSDSISANVCGPRPPREHGCDYTCLNGEWILSFCPERKL